MKVDMNQFLASFFDEAEEHIENMEAALLELESSPNDSELLNTIFRAAHTIKGASSTFGVTAVAAFTHVMENVLDQMRNGDIAATPDTSEVLLTSVDTLRCLLDSACNGAEEPDNIEGVLSQLQALSASDVLTDKFDSSATSAADRFSEGEAQETDYRVVFKPSREFFHFGLDPILLLRDLSDLGTVHEVELDDSALPPLDELDPESCYLAWTLRLTTTQPSTEIEDVFMFVDDSTVVNVSLINSDKQEDIAGGEEVSGANELAPGSIPTEGSTTAKVTAVALHRESVRVDGERLDDMINQIGELVIGVSMVEEEWAKNHPTSDSPAIVQLSKIVRELQERSLSLRMVPIGACFQKMTRLVRDLSRKLGKQIEFVTSGEETELDKTVVDKIGDPLLHMIRNAVDHGIETEAERIAAGKSPKGTVALKAYHKGGNIYLEILDDGKGLDLERIKAKAIERGLFGEDDSPSDTELANVIFAPGFSTADTVTDVSGRGVGMDVVRRNVESLQGSVSVRTRPGEGSTVTVRLPLTLAILDGLTVRLGSEVLVLPLLSVVESIRPAASDLKSVVNRGEVVMLRGEVVPLIRLHEVLKFKTDIQQASDGLLVIVEEQNRKFALLVDELLGQQQVVIKNLETNFQKVPGVAGATILGNGRVAFILDVNGICALSKGTNSSRPESQEPAAT